MLTPMMNKNNYVLDPIYISFDSILHFYFNYVVHVLKVSSLQCTRKAFSMAQMD